MKFDDIKLGQMVRVVRNSQPYLDISVLKDKTVGRVGKVVGLGIMPCNEVRVWFEPEYPVPCRIAHRFRFVAADLEPADKTEFKVGQRVKVIRGSWIHHTGRIGEVKQFTNKLLDPPVETGYFATFDEKPFYGLKDWWYRAKDLEALKPGFEVGQTVRVTHCGDVKGLPSWILSDARESKVGKTGTVEHIAQVRRKGTTVILVTFKSQSGLPYVAEQYRYMPEELELVEAPETKFKVGQKVKIVGKRCNFNRLNFGDKDETIGHVGKITDIDSDIYVVEFDQRFNGYSWWCYDGSVLEAVKNSNHTVVRVTNTGSASRLRYRVTGFDNVLPKRQLPDEYTDPSLGPCHWSCENAIVLNIPAYCENDIPRLHANFRIGTPNAYSCFVIRIGDTIGEFALKQVQMWLDRSYDRLYDIQNDEAKNDSGITITEKVFEI